MRIRNYAQPLKTNEKHKEIVLVDVERLLQPVDSAIHTPKSKHSLKAVIACKVDRSCIAVHEYIHINAQGGVEQMCSKHLAEGEVAHTEGESLSL